MSEGLGSPIEKALELSMVLTEGPNVFSSTQNPSWHPPGTRSIYGGTVIAQSLAAASSTLQSPSFQVHSMHCYFIRRASSDEAIFFYVEATSDGYSFANRTIQARQNGAVVATATVSFTLSRREKQGYLRHFSPIATSAAGGNIKHDIPGSVGDPVEIQSGAEEALESCISRTLNRCSPCLSAPYQKRQYYWMRAVGPITAPAGNAVHCHALAYLSDRYLFGTLARIYGLYDFGSPESSLSMQKTIYGRGWCANEAAIQDADSAGKIEITKMLSLDHTMYFHKTGGFRADEWLLFEMQTPWADDERALIVQKVFTGEGSLVATCVQEGMLRIKRKSDQTERLGGELQQLQAMTGKGSSSANDSKI